jgi:hypothetical protein
MPNFVMRKKARLGDIVEIKTPAGFGYVQYTYDAETNGQLVRVLPGLYEDRPSNFGELAQQKELYFVFLILNRGFRTGIGEMELVSNQPIPEWAISPPIMRHSAATDAHGKTIRWRIIHADTKLTLEELQRAPVLTHLTPDQRRLSIREIWPPAVMVRRLAERWSPERAEE